MKESLIFEAAEFSAESQPSAWHRNLGPGISVPRQSIADEVTGNHQAYHPLLGPAVVVSRSAITGELPQDEEIIGTDERVRVGATTDVPFRWICALDLYFPDPDNVEKLLRFVGSGTLIGRRHVLTAGHCLFNSIRGTAGTVARAQVAAIAVAPGRNGSSNPLGTTVMQSLQMNATWRSSLNPRFDYGLIELRHAIGDQAKPALGGKKLGYWGDPSLGAGTLINPLSQAALKGQAVNISGYPADKPSGTQWRAAGSVVNTSPAAGAELVYYDIDTCGGHSGSPIWVKSGEARNLVAVHHGGCILGADCSVVPGAPCLPLSQKRTSNSGVRISTKVLQELRLWITGAPPPARPILRRGSKGSTVAELQTRLNAWRARTPGITPPQLVVDSDFGPKTQAMVIEFQKWNALTVDGVVGPQTWGALLAL